MSIDQEIKNSMDHAIEHYKKELKTLRTGRANPGILDTVMVEVYGTSMKLKDVANVTTPEARQLLITPYDGNNAPVIGKAIENANLNLQPMVDGNVIRINIPPMDESIRKDMVKQGKKKAEDAKVAVREIRRKFNDQSRAKKADGDITEDELKRNEKKIQEKTDDYCKMIDKIASEKEKEILEI
ncbi:MAG TPA: ribosome recycling factor [Chlamydiales bacterium]|nr:ribosome recycling factor [Chlamydiales bacterium]